MQEVQSVLNRVMQLQEFYVEFEISEDFCFHGRFPFSLMINEQGFAVAKVVALTHQEADDKVMYYFIQSSAFWDDTYYSIDDEDDEDDDEDE